MLRRCRAAQPDAVISFGDITLDPTARTVTRAGLPVRLTAKEFDLEGCAALEPDLVILPIKLKNAVETLEGLDIDVLLVNPENQEQLTGMLKEQFAAGGYTAKEKAPGYETPAYEPWTDGETYLNPRLNDFTACTEVQNGFYQLSLVKGSTAKLYLAKDKATAEKVLSQESVQLMFDQSNVIVDIVQ